MLSSRSDLILHIQHYYIHEGFAEHFYDFVIAVLKELVGNEETFALFSQ